MTRLVQVKHPQHGRRVTVVHENKLRFLADADSIYSLAQLALANRQSLELSVAARVANDSIDYETVHSGKSDWRFLPAFDHPYEPARCLVTGTGLTHKKSAENRQAMHSDKPAAITDSMRMYQWGLERGRPAPGA